VSFDQLCHALGQTMTPKKISTNGLVINDPEAIHLGGIVIYQVAHVVKEASHNHLSRCFMLLSPGCALKGMSQLRDGLADVFLV
jgi:hypothetical protein